jgi:hypothetical protein
VGRHSSISGVLVGSRDQPPQPLTLGGHYPLPRELSGAVGWTSGPVAACVIPFVLRKQLIARTQAPWHHGVMTQNAKPLTVRLPDELAEALRNYAFVTDTSANEVIKVALAEYLTAHAHTDVVGAAFNRALKQHAIAFDKLANL